MSERDGLGKKGLLGFAGLSGAAMLLACLGSLYVNAHGNNAEHRYGVMSWLIYEAIFVPASAEERLKVIAFGPHLKDWRFKICGEYGCVDKVVVCAPGYHIIYGNRCVVNIHSPPSWEDQVQPVVPPCEGCWTTHPTLYELTLGQLGAVTSGASNAAHFRRGRLRRRHFCWHASCKVFEVSGVICDARTSLDLGRLSGRPFSVSRVPCILDTAAGPPVAPTAILMTGRPKGRPFLILSIGFSRPFLPNGGVHCS
jgi:hypothetical protein